MKHPDMVSLNWFDPSKIPPRERRDWHGWKLKGDDLSYPAYPGGNRYGFSITRCTSSAVVLDIIAQVGVKAWATEQCVVGLVYALDDILHWQANLCSCGQDKHMTPSQIKKRTKTLI